MRMALFIVCIALTPAIGFGQFVHDPIRASVTVSETRVPAGSTFDVVVDFELDAGVHLYKNKISSKWEKLVGVEHVENVLPTGRMIRDEWGFSPDDSGMIEVYEGSVRVAARMRATGKEGDRITILGKLSFAGCSDEICYPPGTLPIELNLITAAALTGQDAGCETAIVRNTSMGEIIDGKSIAEAIRAELKAEIASLTEKVGRPPGLGVILVGDNPASKVYVRHKRKACDELNIFSQEFLLPNDAPEEMLRKRIQELNADDRIDGILLQLPLPAHLDEDAMVSLIDPDKDVDGFHKLNLGRLLWGKELFVACTPLGIQQLLLRSGVEIEGKHVVIVGRSNIVGKPLAALLMQKKAAANATVTVCHSRTRNLGEITRTADILVAAMGRARTITADMVKPGAVVVDVGINRIPDESKKSGYRLVGDVDFDAVKEVASMITPVPGGVGPMTIAMLMSNTVRSFKMRNGIEP